MSNFAVNLARLEIFPHPNAERLELAQVGLFRAVVVKGQYETGDIALYIPESSILPDELIAEIGLNLAGPKHNRVKTIRLRGELSQELALTNDVDFADDLGISKWIPEVPANMGGEVFSAPRILSWVEIDNIKAHPNVFVPGEPVTATEKLHGTCCLASLDLSATEPRDAFLVSSKGMGSKKLALIEADNNLYWRALRQHDAEAKMRDLVEHLGTRENPVTRLGLFGEVYGAGVQDLTYGVSSRNTPGYAVFDAYVERTADAGRWLDQDELRGLCAQIGLPMVPEIYAGPYDYATLAVLSEGPSVQAAGANIREGVVVRPAKERYSPELGTRLIAKFVSAAYLTRDGEVTEYE
jgi:RNA ligase (TIGR02306 family)